MNSLQSLYHYLQAVDSLTFYAKSGAFSQMAWNYQGDGDVSVRVENGRVYFNEQIRLNHHFPFQDQKMWAFDDDLLTFYHFRHGRYQAIFQFEVQENGQFQLLSPYHCVPDCYQAGLVLQGDSLFFSIAIQGERKSEQLTYHYQRSKNEKNM